ncbi:MAG: phage tail tape measure protein, partial [Planctomycetota bacterium]
MSPSQEATETASELGLTFNESMLIAAGLRGTLERVAEATKGNVAAMSRLFPNIRALTGVMSLAGSQSKEFARQLEAMGKAAGATGRAAEKMMADLGFRSKVAWASIRDSLGRIGDVFAERSAGLAETVAGWISKAADWVEEHAEQIQGTIDRLTNWLHEKWRWLQLAVRDVLYAWGIEDNNLWDGIKTAAQKAWDFVRGIWGKAMDLLAPVFKSVAQAWEGDWRGAWQTVLHATTEGIKSILDIMEHWLPEFIQMGINFVDELIKGLTDSGTIAKAAELIGKIAEVLLSTENIAKYVDWGVQIGTQIAKGLWRALSDGLTDWMERAGQWMSENKWSFGPAGAAIITGGEL